MASFTSIVLGNVTVSSRVFHFQLALLKSILFVVCFLFCFYCIQGLFLFVWICKSESYRSERPFHFSLLHKWPQLLWLLFPYISSSLFTLFNRDFYVLLYLKEVMLPFICSCFILFLFISSEVILAGTPRMVIECSKLLVSAKRDLTHSHLYLKEKEN